MALLWDIINMIVRIGALRYNNFFAIVSYIENMSLNLFISRKETDYLVDIGSDSI
jgi:hypothetical protein